MAILDHNLPSWQVAENVQLSSRRDPIASRNEFRQKLAEQTVSPTIVGHEYLIDEIGKDLTDEGTRAGSGGLWRWPP
ncbi:MAG: hypothetical protein ACLQDL_01120 [Spirochaetia bacterium]